MRTAPLESQDMVALFQWASYQTVSYPELDLLAHWPNEGKRSPRTGAHLKAQGMKRGMPDLMLPVSRMGFHGLFVELKVGKNSLTKDQERKITQLVGQGYAAGVVWGWAKAAQVLTGYLQSAIQLPHKVYFQFRETDVLPRQFDYTIQ